MFAQLVVQAVRTTQLMLYTFLGSTPYRAHHRRYTSIRKIQLLAVLSVLPVLAASLENFESMWGLNSKAAGTANVNRLFDLKSLDKT